MTPRRVWRCKKCGHGEKAHRTVGHEAFGHVPDMRLVEQDADAAVIRIPAAELAALRADAARYRWLRDVAIKRDWCVTKDADRTKYARGVHQYHSDNLDAAIDAALKERAP